MCLLIISPNLIRRRPDQKQGSWGGKGSKKRRTDPRFLKTTEGILPTQRKDFSRSNVIISEKKDKKASKFLVKDLPFPYTSIEQYEASLRTPVGSEWNSRIGYQRETVPKIQKKVSFYDELRDW